MFDNNRVTRTIYISSGLLNGFYTLRSRTEAGLFSTDIYLRNLSTDQDKAEAKAREYFDRVYGDTAADVRFEGFADFDLTPWGKALKPWERAQMGEIEAGCWPFGKHKGARIEGSPEGYIVYWAEQTADASKPVALALIEVCRSIADSKGLRVKFEERRKQVAAQRAADAVTSRHVGTVGKRDTFAALTLRALPSFDSMYGRVYIHILADAAGNVLIYKGGKALANVGDTVTLKATVKEHGEREGTLQTILSRPALAA
jgi:uncharacterized protein (DUF3820 family)